MSERRKLHERISETFEPRPQQYETAEMWDRCMASEGESVIATPGGYWRFALSGYENGDKVIVTALNYDTDEDVNARLLEAMPCPRLLKDQNGIWGCRPNYLETEGLWPFSADRKIAIVDAYCRWKNLA